MIPRHQIVILIGLLVGSIIMGVVLWNLRERAHKRLLQGESTAPTQAPQVAPAEQATLMVASDTDDTVNARVFTLPLPQNPEARARAILGRLFELYAAPDSAHPVPGGPNSIAQVFLLPAPNGGRRRRLHRPVPKRLSAHAGRGAVADECLPAPAGNRDRRAFESTAT